MGLLLLDRWAYYFEEKTHQWMDHPLVGSEIVLRNQDEILSFLVLM